MKLTSGALTSLHDSAIKRGADPDSVRLVLTLLLKSAIKNYQGTQQWAENEATAAEEELAAIAEASGLIVADDAPAGIMGYVTGETDR